MNVNTFFKLTAASLAGLATSAMAQLPGALPDAPIKGDVQIMAGIMLNHGPAYAGSDDSKTRGLPLIQARWRSGWFAGTTGVGLQRQLGESSSVGLRLGFDPGRKSGDSDDLIGMADIKARPELAVFGTHALMPGLRATGQIKLGSGNERDGLVTELELRTGSALGPGRLLGGISLSWANSAAMQSQFGTAAAQQLGNRYALYTPSAGLRDTKLTLSYMLPVGPQTMLQIGATLKRLSSAAAESPLVQSRSQTGLNVGLMYRFD